jgi:hypothetical protein
MELIISFEIFTNKQLHGFKKPVLTEVLNVNRIIIIIIKYRLLLRTLVALLRKGSGLDTESYRKVGARIQFLIQN